MERAIQHYRLDKPTLITGDFNLHHPWWNCTADEAKATTAGTLVSWLESQNATLLIDNDVIEEKGGTYHRSNLKTISVIDLAFTTGFKRTTWGNWHYSLPTGLDHEVISFQALTTTTTTGTTSTGSILPSFNLKKADWELFSIEL